MSQTSHDLHPENRGQTETQSGYPRSPPHRPSGTLLRWEAQFRRGTARNQCSALTVRGRHAVIQERESEGDGPPVLQVLPEGQSVRELLHQPHAPLLSDGRLRLRCPLRQGRPRRRGRVEPPPPSACTPLPFGPHGCFRGEHLRGVAPNGKVEFRIAGCLSWRDRAVRVCSHLPLPRRKSRTPKFIGSVLPGGRASYGGDPVLAW